MKRSIRTLQPNEKVQLQYYTDMADKLKGGKANPFKAKTVRKLTTVFATISGQGVYADRVRQQLVAEGKSPRAYEEKARPWGERVGSGPLIEHNDTMYLEFIVEKTISTTYMVDGIPTEPEDIQGFPEERTRSDTAQGGVDKEIKLRCVKEENIISIVDIVQRRKQTTRAKVTFDVDVDIYDNGTDLQEQVKNAVTKMLAEVNTDGLKVQPA